MPLLATATTIAGLTVAFMWLFVKLLRAGGTEHVDTLYRAYVFGMLLLAADLLGLSVAGFVNWLVGVWHMI